MEYFHSLKEKGMIVFFILCAGVVSWANMSALQKDRYLSLTFSEDSYSTGTARGRIDGWMANFRTALSRPIVGHGLGTSQEATYHTRGGKAKIAHILYMEVLIEIGIVGFFFYFAFIKSIYNVLKNIRIKMEKYSAEMNTQFPEDEDDLAYDKNLLTALAACFWMYIVFSFAQYGMSQYHWYFLAGMVVILERNLMQKVKKLQLQEKTSEN